MMGRDPVQAAAVRAYTALVEQARTPALYEAPPEGYGVPDTVEGRFDLVTLHVFLFLRRLKEAPEDTETGTGRFAQMVFDIMFRNMDDSLREMGVGDMKVPDKVRGLAEAFYGRVGAYDGVMDDRAALADALSRNVYGTDGEPAADALAAYVQRAAGRLDATPITTLTDGTVPLPAPRRQDRKEAA